MLVYRSVCVDKAKIGDSLTKPQFKLTSAEVVIICPEARLKKPTIMSFLDIPHTFL